MVQMIRACKMGVGRRSRSSLTRSTRFRPSLTCDYMTAGIATTGWGTFGVMYRGERCQ